MKKIALGIVAACATTLCFGLSWDGVKTVDVPLGTTQTLDASEALTGSGSIFKTGGGTLLFSNAGNTFTGGIETREGYVKSTAVGSFGSGDITISGEHTAKSAKNTIGKNTNQVWFAASGTYPNRIFYKMTKANVNLDTPNGIEQATLRVAGNVTLSGDVFLWENGCDIRTSANTDTATFTGTITGKDSTGSGDRSRKLFVWVTGKADFTELWNVALDCASWGHEGGTVIIRNKGRVTAVSMARSLLELYADNVLDDAYTDYLYWTSIVNTYAPASSGNKGIIDVHGHDQTIKSITWSAGQKLTSALNGSAIRSTGAPATITLKQSANIANCGMRFDDQVNLVYDGTAKCALTTRVHTTTGTLTVKQGKLRLTGDATMAKLRSIDVQGGTFSVESTQDSAFASVTNVTVAANATLTFADGSVTPFGAAARYCKMTVEPDGILTLPAGVTLYVSAFTYHGTAYSMGDYTDAAWGGGTITIRPAEAADAIARTWTGQGGNTAITTAGNWDGTFEPYSFAMMPRFATGGTVASLDVDPYLAGLRFELPAGATSFTLEPSPANQTRTITLGSRSLRTTRAMGDLDATKTYTINAAIELTAPQNWAAETNDTVILAQPVSTLQGNTLALGDYLHFIAGRKKSTFDFAGGLTNFWGNIIVSNGLVKITGSVGSAEHTEGTFTSLGYWGGCTRFYGDTTVYKNSVWENANVADVPGGDVQDTCITFAPNSTTVFKGSVTNRRSGKYWVEENATAIFEGGFSEPGKMFARGKSNSAYVFRGAGMTMTGNAGPYPSLSGGDGLFVETKMIFESPNNRLVNPYVNAVGAELVFRTNYVQSLTETIARNGNRLGILQDGTIDFTTTTQRFEIVWAYLGKMKGEYPATIETKTPANMESAIKTSFEGWLGLSNLGEGTTVVSNSVSQSFGDLYVSAGTLKIDDRSSWTKGTNVTVTGTGTLKLCASNQLNRHQANLSVSESGILDLASGTTTHVENLIVDGTAIPPGTYSKATAPASLAAHLSGSGTIQVNGGICLIVR